MYRKVPGDLLEGSKEGNTVSLAALAVIAILVLKETLHFLIPHLVTDLSLDSHRQGGGADKIQVNFNITLMDLKCQVRREQC